MELGAILFHSVTSKFSSAVKLLWSYGQANVRFGLAAQYRIDGTSSANVRIDILLSHFELNKLLLPYSFVRITLYNLFSIAVYLFSTRKKLR